jgi:hypothetical protein
MKLIIMDTSISAQAQNLQTPAKTAQGEAALCST